MILLETIAKPQFLKTVEMGVILPKQKKVIGSK